MVEKKSSKGKDTLNDAEELKVTNQEIVRKDKMKKLAQENIELFPHKEEKQESRSPRENHIDPEDGAGHFFPHH